MKSSDSVLMLLALIVCLCPAPSHADTNTIAAGPMGSTLIKPLLGTQGGGGPANAAADFPKHNLSSADVPGFQDPRNTSAHTGPDALPFPSNDTQQPPQPGMDGMPPFNASQVNGSRPFQPRMGDMPPIYGGLQPSRTGAGGRPQKVGMHGMPPIYGGVQLNRTRADGRPQKFGMYGMPPIYGGLQPSRTGADSRPQKVGMGDMPPVYGSRANSTDLPSPMGDAKMPSGFDQSGRTDPTSSQVKPVPDATTPVPTAGNAPPELSRATEATSAAAGSRQDKRKNRFMFDRAAANSATTGKQAGAVPQ
ncbi:MAG: hypothetical protein WDW36_000608 [Sanguina aurantia]